MRIESVTAHAFGPLEGQTLDLAPGLTIIFGANESAKSSWHAAMYSALCGRRRGKGATTKEERRYAELHRPWDGSEWRVSAVVVLDDGRRIELTHDLEGKVDCRATDTALSRDVSAEIMFEGSPDGSRFLGVDRRSFAATACVNQAELLTVLNAAGGLQEHLQRAAATAGTDATAAAALDCLRQFFRERVGQDRANSTRPLRAAKNRLDRAERALTTALAQHDEYLALIEQADGLRQEATRAHEGIVASERTAKALEELLAASRSAAQAQAQAERTQEAATNARSELDRLATRCHRAHEIHDRFGGEAPPGVRAQEDVARSVVEALAAWRAKPARRLLIGPTAAELTAELEALPEMPEGDLAMDPTVRRLISQFEQASAVCETHESRRPKTDGTTSDQVLAAAVAAGPALLRELAASLAAAEEPDHHDSSDASGIDAISKRLREAQDRQRETSMTAELAQRNADEAEASVRRAASAPVVPEAAHSGSRRLAVAMAAAGMAALAGILLLVASQWIPGAVFMVVAAVATAVGLAGRPAILATPAMDPASEDAAAFYKEAALVAERARREAREADRLVAECEGRLAAAEAAASRRAHVWEDLRAQCRARGLPEDATTLRTLAAQAELLMADARWASEAEQLRSEVDRAESNLRSALSARGVGCAQDPTVTVNDAIAKYEKECAARAEQASQAERRGDLQPALSDRLAAESAAAAADAAHERAAGLLVEAARAVGLLSAGETESPDLGDLVAGLESWQERWSEQLQQAELDQQDWAELSTLLEGSTLAELDASVSAQRARHATLVEEAEQAAAVATEADASRAALAAALGLDTETGRDPELVGKLLARAREELATARRATSEVAAAAEKAEGALTERARSLPSVPEAEEELAGATEELARVNELAHTLELTSHFLTVAQERVHRDMAPVLASTLSEWLPSVTDGRYVDARVDPASLLVQVRGRSGRWRHADRLSIGTAEQVYLLLRMALAQHLAPSESCPLLLDDVTVQADESRTRQILDLLLRLSEQRQIVLFAQELTVAEWAREHLRDQPDHGLRELAQLTTD